MNIEKLFAESPEFETERLLLDVLHWTIRRITMHLLPTPE